MLSLIMAVDRHGRRYEGPGKQRITRLEPRREVIAKTAHVSLDLSA
jgi:hypothetical protein